MKKSKTIVITKHSNHPADRAGHPAFFNYCDSMAELHEKKNHDYAKGGPPLGNFERVSAFLSLYPGLDLKTPEGVALVYMLKQLDAYLWLSCQGHTSKTGEGKLERLFDVGVYTGIIMCREKDKQSEVK